MEDLRISASGSRGGGATLSRRAPNGSAGRSNYDDVFGGPPRYSGPFAARPADYSEIFGGLSSSCSIPVLDLPPALDGLDAQSSGLDYFEIFGGFGGEDLALSYEELVAEQERVEPRRMEILSSYGRVPKETEFGQQVTEVSEFSPDGANREQLAYLGKDKISFNANHLDDGSKQLNMSYHMMGRGNIEDTITETVHLTQLHAVPGFTFDVDSRPPLHNTSSGHPPNMLTNDLGLNAALNDGVSYQKEGKTFSLSSSSASPESFGNDLKTDHKQFATKCPTEDGPVNLMHHSRSSSNHSTSSGDIYYPDSTFLTVSDISLRTQPLHVPPPARPPPKLVNNQEIPKMKIYAHSKYDADEASLSKPIENHQKNSGCGPPKRHAPQVAVRESSYFFDVEVDASSAAAASAAAMKEAMEQAQARLKSAKESMERKREYFQSRKKLGQQEGTKFKEGKDNKTAQEVEIFSEVLTQKSFLEEGKKKNESALEERQKARGTAKIAPDQEEKERHILSDEQNQQKVRGDGFKSQESYKSNERSGEWKTGKQFYELVNNEKNFKVVKELSDQECAEMIQKVPIKVNKEKGIMSKETNLSYAFGRKGNLWEVDEIQEREENAKKKSDAGKTICREDKIKELPNTVTEVCGKEENVIEDISDSHEQVKNENKLGGTQKACDSEEDLKMSDTGEVVPACGKIEVKLKPSVDACKFELVHESEKKERKLEADKEVFEHDDSEDLSGTYVSCQSHDSEKKFKTASKTSMQVENETEIKVPDASYMSEGGDKVEAAPELNQCKHSENSREKTKLECYEEENEDKLEVTSLISEQEENKKLNKTEEAPMLVENETKPKAAQATNEIQLDLAQLQSTQGVVQSRENEKIETAKVCSHDHNENKNEEEQKTVHVPRELENSEVLTVSVRMHEKKETKHIKEVHLDENVKVKYKIFNAAREVFQTAVNKDLEDGLETRVFEKKGDMLTSAQNITETCSSVVTENSTTEIRRIEEMLNERRMERDGEQEKEIKLEEEKERAREREKDRIAVERASREAHERAFAEAREKAERIAVERVTAEARQRALAEAREKAEKASAEALEKTLAEKASREARLRVERAAVERATAEARERAVERALAEKAAADARERTEKLNAAASKDRARRDNEADEHFRASDEGDNGARDFPHDVQFQSAGSSSNAQRHSESYNHGEGESALRCKARLERHQRTVERAAKALAEKNMRDMLAQREQTERNRLSETLDADVKRWSTGKEGNLRALLSTLQYILGHDSGWQPIPLTDVITAAAVKKAYRKATLCVHPDKLQQRGASIQQKYICEKVFDLLKDAWNRFNSEER